MWEEGYHRATDSVWVGACGLCAGKHCCLAGSNGSKRGAWAGTVPAVPPSPPGTHQLPAPWQLHPLCSSCWTLSCSPCSPPKASGRILPLTACPVTTPPGDQFGVQHVGLGAASMDLGYAGGCGETCMYVLGLYVHTNIKFCRGCGRRGFMWWGVRRRRIFICLQYGNFMGLPQTISHHHVSYRVCRQAQVEVLSLCWRTPHNRTQGKKQRFYPNSLFSRIMTSHT